MAGRNSAAGKVSSKSVFGGQFGGGEKFGCGKSVFEKRLREVIRWRGEIRLREKCLRKTSSRGNSVAEGNSAAGKVSSPDHINVSSKKVFGGARKSATRNACAMQTYTDIPSSILGTSSLSPRKLGEDHELELEDHEPSDPIGFVHLPYVSGSTVSFFCFIC